MPTCKEIARALTSEEFEEASWWDRLKMRWHQWRCPPCQRFAEQMEKVGDTARSMVDPEDRLSAAAREQIVARCLEGVDCEEKR